MFKTALPMANFLIRPRIGKDIIRIDYGSLVKEALRESDVIFLTKYIWQWNLDQKYHQD